MVEVFRSAIIQAPIEVVWNLLRDFNGHDRWHPAVAESHLEGADYGDQIGAVRHFRLVGGGWLREQLLSHSDSEYCFSYCIVESPIPLVNYFATVRLKPATDSGATLWEWRSRFEPPAGRRDELVKLVGDGIYAAGFRACKSILELGVALKAPEPPFENTPIKNRKIEHPTFGSQSSALDAEAVLISRFGGPEVLEINRVSVAPPSAGEIRIRQTAVGVNYIDVYCRTGYFELVKPPGILGMEAAGIVESIGAGVSDFQIGDRVAYACAPTGAYASIRTMSASLVVPIPSFVDDELAAAILLKGVTASFLLHDIYQVQKGNYVLIHAAAGGVGSLLVQWASSLGATVIGTTSTQAKAEEVRAAGAKHVIVYRDQDFVDEVMRVTNGCGVDVVYDAVGKDTFEKSIQAMAVCGHIVSFGQASGDIGPYEIGRLAGRSVTLSRPNYGHYTDTPEKMRKHSARLFSALREGRIKARRPAIYKLAEASRAHADLESRITTGSLVLLP
jgi:NADPH:quinone reductase-like Zn-dependent oxidoreductase